ncbi:large ribosomal subunit protein mL66 isoform X2 [Anabrus simplex]|uniref:large ribosomal subunit protein mL66 isoform X2 n=1 Tax=Anabrus simplex TaxID=316456 RepID=UPI0034DD3145
MALKFCRFWRLLHGIKNESDFYVVPRSISFPKGSVGFKTSVGTFIKEIQETRDGNVRVIEGINLPSPREPYMLKTAAENGSCPVCRTGLDIKHTDVLILSQFVRPDGCMLPRRVTGLCKKQQKRISKMVAMAQKADFRRIRQTKEVEIVLC